MVDSTAQLYHSTTMFKFMFDDDGNADLIKCQTPPSIVLDVTDMEEEVLGFAASVDTPVAEMPHEDLPKYDAISSTGTILRTTRIYTPPSDISPISTSWSGYITSPM